MQYWIEPFLARNSNAI